VVGKFRSVEELAKAIGSIAGGAQVSVRKHPDGSFSVFYKQTLKAQALPEAAKLAAEALAAAVQARAFYVVIGERVFDRIEVPRCIG